MRYPIVTYLEVEDAKSLQLHLFDGTARLVEFATGSLAAEARRPGRAEIDAAAILNGRLPAGGVGVPQVVARSPSDLLRETFEVDNPASYGADEEHRIRACTSAAVTAAPFKLVQQSPSPRR